MTQNLPSVSGNNTVFEHQPMYSNVAEREALAEYVSSLQVMKRDSVVATARGIEGATDFGIDSVMQRITHR